MAVSDSFERLYEAHAQALYSFLVQYTRSEADAHDLLQETFVRLASRPELLQGVEKTRAFLLRMARNQAIDLSRRHATRQKAAEELGRAPTRLFAPAPDADEQAFREALSTALLDLPVEQREVVHLKLWEELTFEEIAQLLEIPLNTAASRYRYGLDKLRARLRPLYDEIQ